jgi:hypothetical protein
MIGLTPKNVTPTGHGPDSSSIKMTSDKLTPTRKSYTPLPTQKNAPDYFSAAPTPSMSPTPITEEPGLYPAPASGFSTPSNDSTDSHYTGPSPLSEAEKKRIELQCRVQKARALVPYHIPLRIFRSPEECLEAEEILEKLHVTALGT